MTIYIAQEVKDESDAEDCVGRTVLFFNEAERSAFVLEENEKCWDSDNFWRKDEQEVRGHNPYYSSYAS